MKAVKKMNPIGNLTLILGSVTLPLVSIAIGFILWKNPPEINTMFGFRTKLSMNSERNWLFAQALSGKLMVIVFAPMTVISAAVSAFAMSHEFNSDQKFWLLGGLIIFEIVLIIAVNIYVDYKLKKAFKEGDTDNGK